MCFTFWFINNAKCSVGWSRVYYVNTTHSSALNILSCLLFLPTHRRHSWGLETSIHFQTKRNIRQHLPEGNGRLWINYSICRMNDMNCNFILYFNASGTGVFAWKWDMGMCCLEDQWRWWVFSSLRYFCLLQTLQSEKKIVHFQELPYFSILHLTNLKLRWEDLGNCWWWELK